MVVKYHPFKEKSVFMTFFCNDSEKGINNDDATIDFLDEDASFFERNPHYLNVHTSEVDINNQLTVSNVAQQTSSVSNDITKLEFVHFIGVT